LPYRWWNERGYFTYYQSLLLLHGDTYGAEWEQVEFESFLAEKHPKLLRAYKWRRRRKLLREYLRGILSAFKSFLRV